MTCRRRQVAAAGPRDMKRDIWKRFAGLGDVGFDRASRPTQSLRLPDMKTQRLYVMTPAIFEGWGKEA